MRRISTKRAAIRVGAPALLAALAASLVVACTSPAASSGSSEPGDYSGAAAAAATQAAPERANAGADTAAGGAAAAPAPEGVTGSGSSAEQMLGTVPVDGTQVIRTADLSVRLEVEPVPATDDAAADRDANAKARADAVAAAAGSLRAAVATAGGFVAGADGGGSALTVTLRVPADQYDAVLDKIGGLGQVTNRTESS